MTEPDPVRPTLIALADDHPIMRAALMNALRGLGANVVFLEAGDAPSTLTLVGEHADIDLLLLDLNMPGGDGVATVRAVRSLAPAVPVAVVSAEEDPGTVTALLALGVCGFIPKTDPPQVIVGAVRLILAGGTYVPPRLVEGGGRHALRKSDAASDDVAARLGLTARQLDVVRCLAQGKPNKLIARELGVTEGTVKVHLLAVFRALDVGNRTAAVIAAKRYLD